MPSKTHRGVPGDVASLQNACRRVQRVLHHDVAVLTLDHPPVNAIGFAMIEELCCALRIAIANPQVRGIVVTGGPKWFSAGADVAIFDALATESDAVDLSRRFQEAFSEIEASPKPVVAAVAGQVLGGALELAMACHRRIAVEDSRFAMPEVNLGIVPGAGGTQRLPRLVGLPRALEMLQSGRPVSAADGQAWGLIDAICSAERLIETAIEAARSATFGRTMDRSVDCGSPADQQQAWAEAEKRAAAVRTENIAPRRAIDCVRAALQPPPAGWITEQEAFAQCMATAAARNKIYVFCARRGLGREEPGNTPLLERAAVIGAGSMGTGIAQALATAGLVVVAVDADEKQLGRARRRIETSLQRRVEQGKLPTAKAQEILARLRLATEWNALADAQLVIEAVPENLELKRAVLHRAESLCSADAILASNTSTLDLDDLAEGLVRGERLIGLHFFQPAHEMPLVEVVRRTVTPAQVLAAGVAVVRAMKKTPLVVENRQGFAVNRLFVPYLTEAFWLLEEGAEPAEIDAAMVDFGFAMGPLQLIDMAGLDILESTQPILARAFPHHGPLSAIVGQLVAAGHCGQKTGAGVYRYEPGDRTCRAHPAAQAMIAAARAARNDVRTWSREAIARRLMLRMIAEAFRLLEERVVARAADLDVAMVLGAGLGDFRGGVVRYAYDLGLPTVIEELRGLEREHGPRYAPMGLPNTEDRTPKTN